MKRKRSEAGKLCPHCGKDVTIRNLSGYCDHLKYPENCHWCQDFNAWRVAERNKVRQAMLDARSLLADALTYLCLQKFDQAGVQLKEADWYLYRAILDLGQAELKCSREKMRGRPINDR